MLALVGAATVGLFGDALRTQNSMRSELGVAAITTADMAVAGSVAALILRALGADPHLSLTDIRVSCS